jgi:eukaryotic-like serine/threonine-protein kinase
MFALKILRSHVEDEQARSRVYRELEIGRTLNHPNLVRIVGFGDHLGSPYLVMDYIEGPTLTKVLEKRILAQGEVLGLFRQMCEGVAYAHRLGVIHRDLKPDNMILTSDGTLKILDFGVARPVGVDSKLTGTGQGIGTPAFMAPEQLLGSPTLESDIYALGVILFMLLTSRLPFDTDDCTDVLAAHLSQKAPPPSSLVPEIHPELDALCQQMLAKHLEERIRSVDLVLKRLEALEGTS